MNGGTKVVICETLRREAALALRLEGLEGAEIVTLPPYDPSESVHALPLDEMAPSDAICIVTGDCLPKEITLPPDFRYVHAIRTARAYELVATKTVIDQLLFEGASIVLPGWVSNWKEYLKVQDEKAFRLGFQQTAAKVSMLETETGNGAAAELREFARFVRLPYEIVPVGMELFSSRLAKCVLKAHLLREQAKRRALEGGQPNS